MNMRSRSVAVIVNFELLASNKTLIVLQVYFFFQLHPDNNLKLAEDLVGLY